MNSRSCRQASQIVPFLCGVRCAAGFFVAVSWCPVGRSGVLMTLGNQATPKRAAYDLSYARSTRATPRGDIDDAVALLYAFAWARCADVPVRGHRHTSAIKLNGRRFRILVLGADHDGETGPSMIITSH